MRAGVFLAHVLITVRKWPQAIQPSSSTPPPATWQRNLYLSSKNSSSSEMHTSVENDLGFAFGKKNKSFALARVCFIVQPLRLWSVSVCASVWAENGRFMGKGSTAFLWLVIGTQLPVPGLAASVHSRKPPACIEAITLPGRPLGQPLNEDSPGAMAGPLPKRQAAQSKGRALRAFLLGSCVAQCRGVRH